MYDPSALWHVAQFIAMGSYVPGNSGCLAESGPLIGSRGRTPLKQLWLVVLFNVCGKLPTSSIAS